MTTELRKVITNRSKLIKSPWKLETSNARKAFQWPKEFMCYTFFSKHRFLSIQLQCCLNFSWIELQMLLRCCLIRMKHKHHYLETLFIFTVFVTMSRPRSICIVYMWYFFIFIFIFIIINRIIISWI